MYLPRKFNKTTLFTFWRCFNHGHYIQHHNEPRTLQLEVYEAFCFKKAHLWFFQHFNLTCIFFKYTTKKKFDTCIAFLYINNIKFTKKSRQKINLFYLHIVYMSPICEIEKTINALF